MHFAEILILEELFVACAMTSLLVVLCQGKPQLWCLRRIGVVPIRLYSYYAFPATRSACRPYDPELIPLDPNTPRTSKHCSCTFVRCIKASNF